MEFEAPGTGRACDPLSSGPCPLIEGLWCGLKNPERPFVVAHGVAADIVFSLGPSEANAGGKLCVR
jgi:hypothetical protein